MYAQDGEDDVVLAYFKDLPVTDRTRRFLDVGAFDGMNVSNTRALVELEWMGVMVEASLSAFRDLLRHHGGNPRVALIHGPLAVASGLTPWWEHSAAIEGSLDRRASMASTTIEDQATRVHAIDLNQNPKQAADAKRWQHFYQPQFTVDDLVKVLPPPYDFISIDTEGTSVDILEAMDLERLRTSIVCAEHNEKSAYVPDSLRGRKDRERSIAHCASFGLTEVLFDNGVNVICAKPKGT